MESNGKIVHYDANGTQLNYTGGVVFGDVGSNQQHSFFQLVHQGRVVPAEFIVLTNGFFDATVKDHPVSMHQELILNYFAQVRCLALGRTEEECREAGIKEEVIKHNVFEGNRPSSSLIFQHLTTHSFGSMFSLYESRVAVEGFISGVNSFDQYGVELGKKLCTGFREQLKGGEESKIKTLLEDNVIGESFRYFFDSHKPKSHSQK